MSDVSPDTIQYIRLHGTCLARIKEEGGFTARRLRLGAGHAKTY